MTEMIKDLIIKTTADINYALNYIIANFNKAEVERETIIVRFDPAISDEDLLNSLNTIWKYEIDSNNTVTIIIKNLSYEQRIQALGCALKTPSLNDPVFLSNVFCLVKGYNTFEEAYFAHEQVFLNDEVEYLDVFDDLNTEIQAVVEKTAEYYVSMLKTCNLVEAVENNPNAVEMETMYRFLFNSMDVTILAKVLSEVKNPAIWETKKIVMNSLGYLGAIAEKFVFTNTMMNLIGTTILEKSVKDSLKDKE